ncbi:TatD family hydrolase [soil metagenome]
MFVDSHCHLDFPELNVQLPEVLARMDAAGVTHALCISTSLPGFPTVRALAESHARLYATVGVHPDRAPGSVEEGQPEHVEPTLEQLIALADHPKVVGIGETGLDYHWHTETEAGALDWQRERFRIHIRASRTTGKPLVIHTRNSADDTLRIMAEEGAGPAGGGAGGVMHCFTETREVARRSLELGFYLSLSGIVTFKNALELKEVAREVPLDRLLIETDSPFLAPVPHRGKTNEPSFVPFVAAEIARLRGITVDEVALATRSNFERLFKLDL